MRHKVSPLGPALTLTLASFAAAQIASDYPRAALTVPIQVHETPTSRPAPAEIDDLAPAHGLTPEQSVRGMKVAAGFEVELAASEPLVRQPVAIEFDDRGRLWVIQYLQYPNPAGLKRVQVDRYSRTQYDRIPEPPPRGPRGADRITILEDTDHDGRMDQGHDFISGLNLASGLAFGYGGVFVINVPYLLFYPDRDRNDIPDQDPEVLLSGFGMEDAHSVANSLTWGPDGWLYGCQGSTVTARVRGIEFQQGVWRYHPITRKFELFCEGGGNSWGLDFDRKGNLFYSTNFGGYVLLHGVPGGYFVKSFAKHGALHNPHAYGYFDHAPHANFHGGHVTVGGIVYQGNSFPDDFQGRYIAADLLGHAVYWHNIEPHGSTVQTSHGGELLRSRDTWFAPTDVTLGPDGAIYVSDWHDARTAHPDPDAQWDRSNGRIYRISARGTRRARPIDFAQLGDDDLIDLHQHPSQWYVRRARLELAYRCQNPEAWNVDLAAVTLRLRAQALTARDEATALEALWTLGVLGGVDDQAATELLDSPHPAVRAWTARLLGDHGQISSRMAQRLEKLAEREPAVEVRQQLACAARRLSSPHALPIITAHLDRDIDNNDPYMPLLWWWAVEQHSVRSRDLVLLSFTRPAVWKSRLGRVTLLPRLTRRYAAEGSRPGLDAVVKLLNAAPDDQSRRTLWSPILQGLGEISSATPGYAEAAASHQLAQIVLHAWNVNPADSVLQELAIELGGPEPFEAAQRDAFDPGGQADRRVALLDMLAQTNKLSLIDPALRLVGTDEPEAVRRAGLRILAHFDNARITGRLMDLYASSASAPLRSQICDILLSRVSSARIWLAAVDGGEIDARDVPLEQVRRVALLEHPELNALVAKHWGHLQARTPEEKLAEVRRLNNDLRAAAGNPAAGRVLFKKHCATCHTLFGEGGKLGPDLTSANRKDRDFLLISLVDPDNVIRKEYASVMVLTTDGRVLTGLPLARGDTGLTLANAKDERVALRAAEIEEVQDSSVSLMPGDLYREFKPRELRDLFAYLQSETGE